MKIFQIILRVIVFIILLVLAINNMQSVEFNFLGIYTLKLPLIITLAIFALGGLLFGMLFGFMNNLNLKSQINKLKKQLTKQQEAHDKIDQII
ncbi:MAG: lipopolysaccharide assembly protein LapA domain-containing protein [Burkholderiales bacterium]|nr:lipopolysaccharide assembly protein LapA domain-containing protein [Burkholderiales bacterium]